MDQFIIRKGKRNHALLINCKNLDSVLVEMPSNIGIIVIDTVSPRELTTSPYNQRIRECKEALEQFKTLGLEINILSDLTDADLKKYARSINDIYLKRVEHVITENIRVKQFKNALEANDTSLLGKLLYASHESLKNNFEAIWPLANMLVEKCKQIPGIIGARMIGAGWGGSVLVLVNTEKSEKVTSILQAWLKKNFSEEFVLYQTKTANKVSSTNTPLSTLPPEVQQFLSSTTSY